MTTSLPFRDREEAAERLAEALAKYRGTRPVVLGIPRGAMPMARIIADALGGELDVVLVRKLGAPGNPELAIGAVDERGVIMLNENAAWTGADTAYLQREARQQLTMIRERRLRYRSAGARPLSGRTVIVLDDGLATGATMTAALQAVRAQNPARLVCAVPVAAAESLREVARHADDVVCLATPSPFHAVGLYYENFASVEDEEVAEALATSDASSAEAEPRERAVRIPANGIELEGDLVVPPAARGLVVFAHGSGSSRRSTRNRYVAGVLQRREFATLLFDLLTVQEDSVRATRFDIALLARRLQAALSWARGEPATRHLPVGLFGASTGAAAALAVAASVPGDVAVVVSRGGRPDLAGGQALSRIRTPTLLVVGGADHEVLELNRSAQAAIGSWAKLVVVPGATHLFEEPGTLEQAATYAADWFAQAFNDGSGSETTRRAS